MRTLLVRGMLAGLVAGAVAALFAYLVGEPPVEAAIGLEQADPAAPDPHGHDPAAPDPRGHDTHDHAEELVSRGVQRTLGLLTAVGGYGVAVGGLLALAFAVVHGRVGRQRPRVTAVLLTGAVFTSAVLVPFLKYPANPPAVGRPETIGDRTGLYFGFVALSVVFAIAAAWLGRALADRLGGWTGGLLGSAGYLVAVLACAWLLPTVSEVPADFPATTLWSFRVASLGTQLTLWLVLGLVFATLADRALTGSGARGPARPHLSVH
ncbi:CbtA family protein [Goodfellowiella coeruleoviolacea]|uniref:Cobalt transporter subunit (CbtA) n=1 Tax=Goodfellowiella coeruleoviolacea TaxID=334858 RepID=A0AAE3G9H9_9PSEU|nr:CbtA family protein [Goodfellowiella coeruleoviolacea]MCP2163359.1 putative cobalt transporter subunit (CbtA) [Goodfellowiella coeruleoviolacea]